MNPIDTLFRDLRAAGKKAFIPFLPAGDPDLSATQTLLRAAAEAGGHLIEVGFPFSDPIADGPVIQAAYTRALDRGLRVADVLAAVAEARRSPELAEVPLIGMVSYSLVHRRGPATFLERAAEAGLSGAVVPDLPAEEAEPFARLAAERDFKLILLVTPTTPPDRAARIVRLASGFVYCVSVTGITGERDRLPEELLGQLRRLREQTDLPLCVGFGVSRPDHVRMLREAADGVIVGTAIVRKLERAGQVPLETVVAEVRGLIGGLSAALNPAAAG
jgi:tryptophan synthase alpha chain